MSIVVLVHVELVIKQILEGFLNAPNEYIAWGQDDRLIPAFPSYEHRIP